MFVGGGWVLARDLSVLRLEALVKAISVGVVMVC